MLDRFRIEKIAQKLIDKALSRGASMADVTCGSYVGRSVTFRDGVLEKKKSFNSSGIGLRTVDGEGRQGIASLNVLNEDVLDQLVDWSIYNCSISEPEKDIAMSDGNNLESLDIDLDLWDDAVLSLGQSEKEQNCSYLTEKVKAMDKRVVSVRSSSWSDGYGESYFKNSLGSSLWNSGTIVNAGVSVIAQDGANMEIGGYGDEKRHLEELDLDDIAYKAVDLTTRNLGGSPVETGRYDLLFEPELSSSILEFLGEMFLASSIHKNRSLLKGKLGKSIASPLLTLIDDGLLPRGIGSSLYDNEGIQCGKTLLLDSGVVSSYLYNLQYAKKDGVKSTGNGSRGIASLPDVDITNLYMVKGDSPYKDMVHSLDRGLIMTDLMGLHTVNTVTGDFSLGAKALYVEKGVKVRPVSEITIAGNFMDLLRNIDMVGDDLSFFGSIGACSMVVRDVAVAGS